ncbi:prolactin-like [Denticeps clupeoides]|uniref:Uncharacterized protein n=1 Tax=Denticeps clupeoides TaxID=299321 RepID=A0AAY4EAX9_9TELE|nr:prolactin-like [Denticeps clupeoides]
MRTRFTRPCAHLIEPVSGNHGESSVAAKWSRPAGGEAMKQGVPVRLLFLALLSVPVEVRVGAASICAHELTNCHALSLAELFDRVIQHSARMHGLSNQLHTEFEHFYPASKNLIGSRKCHTSYILTPNGKENAQRLAKEELTEVILRLLMAWGEPLSYLHESMSRLQDTYGSSKALEMSGMVYELTRGVQKVAEKMHLLGMMSNSVSSMSSSEMLDQTASRFLPLNDHDLLYCFRRDADKVRSYLKILKCTIVSEQGC